MAKKKYIYGAAIFIANQMQVTPDYVRKVLRGERNNDAILKAANEFQSKYGNNNNNLKNTAHAIGK